MRGHPYTGAASRPRAWLTSTWMMSQTREGWRAGPCVVAGEGGPPGKKGQEAGQVALDPAGSAWAGSEVRRQEPVAPSSARVSLARPVSPRPLLSSWWLMARRQVANHRPF